MEGQTLFEICKLEHMPSRFAVYSWLDKYPEFRERYDSARLRQMESWADEIIEIADSKESDFFCDEHGNTKPNFEHIQRSRLRIDTRKFLMAKIAAKIYGDKPDTSIQIGGSDTSGKVEIVFKKPDGAD